MGCTVQKYVPVETMSIAMLWWDVLVSLSFPHLPTFSMVVGGHDPLLRIVLVVHWVRQQFRIILYFSKDFEEYVTCIKVLNYCN